MRKIWVGFTVLVLSTIVFAGGELDLKKVVDGLMSPDAAVRTESRERILEVGPDALPVVLEAIEAWRAGKERRPVRAATAQIHDVRDLVDGARTMEALEQAVRLAGGDGVDHVDARRAGMLIVRATPAAHLAIREALNRLRTMADRVVTIEARIVQSEAKILPGGVGVQGGFLSRILGEGEVERLLREWEKGEAVAFLSAPRISCYDRQRASVQVGRQISYVNRFVGRRTPDGRFEADPVLETLFEGIQLSLTPILSEDGKFVTVDAEVSVSEVEDPIPTRLTPVPGGGGRTAEVQVPQFRELRAKSSITVPDGGSFLLSVGRVPGEGGDRELLLLLKATKTEIEGVEKK